MESEDPYQFDDGDDVGDIEGSLLESSSGTFNPLESYLAQPGQNDAAARKRERSNAKAVECLDLNGNLVELFRSGMSASQKLNIPQGDISLCCRGLKFSIMGYRFRFFGEAEEKQPSKIRKGFALEGANNETTNKLEVTRTTRASRGDYGQAVKVEQNNKSILVRADLKARTWRREKVKVGPLYINKWLPNAEAPTPALQELLSKGMEGKKGKQSRRKTLNRISLGTAKYNSQYTED